MATQTPLHLTDITTGAATVVDATGCRVARLERSTMKCSAIRDIAHSDYQEAYIIETEVWSWTQSPEGSDRPMWHGAFPTRGAALGDVARNGD